MEQYIVTGMSCAACQARVEKAVSKVPGVQSCAVSLLTNSMGVEGTASAEDIIKEVEQEYGLAGYEGFFSSTDNDEPMRISLKFGRDFIKAGVQELSLPVQTKYGEGKLTATVDKESGQISITYQTPETGDTVDLALVETRNKDNCPIFCNPKPDDNEVASFAIRVYADPYDEAYTNGFDVYVNEVQEAVVEPDEIRDSTKM